LFQYLSYVLALWNVVSTQEGHFTDLHKETNSRFPAPIQGCIKSFWIHPFFNTSGI